MRSDELLSALRLSAFIGDASAFLEYSNLVLLRELNDKLQTVFEDIVVKARAGYWLRAFTYTAIPNDGRYRIPPRSVVGGLEKVEIAQPGSSVYIKIPEVPATLEQVYRQGTSGPAVYYCQGDIIEILPTPTSAISIKMSYYVRPSRLCISQSSTLGGDGVDRGRVTAINTTTRQVTVNTLPFDQSLAVPAAISSGVQNIDIVHPDGWHELSLVNATQTIAGSVFTVGGTDDMTDIQVGDYVRVADQTDWPCLPDDFHRCLADVGAIKVLLELGLKMKADSLAENTGNDLMRFKSLLQPRVKAEPKQIGIMQRSRGGYSGPGWRYS